MAKKKKSERPLLIINPKDTFTLKDALGGVVAPGMVGAGKTSGRDLAKALLKKPEGARKAAKKK